LYRADPHPTTKSGTLRRVSVRREVIVAGGAFNSPQLLMLSGIGPASVLQSHGISVRIDLPGVGRNLQDRYEIGVVSRMSRPWASLAGARFERGDPLHRKWLIEHSGMYVSNGAAIGLARRFDCRRADPDLFLMALLARFGGYFPGYSREIAEHHDYLTWAILKAHTANRAGTVTLRTADPQDTPLVDFNFFDPEDDPNGDDVRAVVAGIRLARQMVAAVNRRNSVAIEELPGPECQTDDQLAGYVRDNAWGHHASCTCAIGPKEANGVLASDFKVHGTTGLRVVDASVFPRIPGFFVAGAVYMAAEKAAEVILADARGPLQRPP
jgi:choline dehydrogenase-like flavoprotein